MLRASPPSPLWVFGMKSPGLMLEFYTLPFRASLDVLLCRQEQYQCPSLNLPLRRHSFLCQPPAVEPCDPWDPLTARSALFVSPATRPDWPPDLLPSDWTAQFCKAMRITFCFHRNCNWDSVTFFFFSKQIFVSFFVCNKRTEQKYAILLRVRLVRQTAGYQNQQLSLRPLTI